MAKSTDNSSGKRESEMVLPQTARNRAIAKEVDALLDSGQVSTRRQGRKLIQRLTGRRPRIVR